MTAVVALRSFHAKDGTAAEIHGSEQEGYTILGMVPTSSEFWPGPIILRLRELICRRWPPDAHGQFAVLMEKTLELEEDGTFRSKLPVQLSEKQVRRVYVCIDRAWVDHD